jgi:hypothetical protein
VGETMEFMLFATIVALLYFTYKREEQMKKERADLLDRIMARTYVEYKEQTAEPVKYEPVTVTEQDEYWMELQEKKV